jgi:restriction system protein
MPLFLVRAGQHGEREQQALSGNFVTIGWNELPDLSGMTDRERFRTLFEKTYPNLRKPVAANYIGQIWTFIDRIKTGDLVVLPLKTRSAIAMGEVTGPYTYRKEPGSDVMHTRPVKWIKTDIPRTQFDQDLLYSFGAFMTVCRIERNNAEERCRAMLKGKRISLPSPEEASPDTVSIDIEGYARDQIMKYISTKFAGHDLARLVEAVLQAQGYVTHRADPGPDGGVDILAGAGPMGFDHPRICVQVKSSSSSADVTVLRNLQGAAQNFAADQSLLVAWGGFNRAVDGEARRSFFTMRLWDSGELVEEVLKYYDRFPDTLKAELPLKKIWGLVIEEAD